MIRDLWSLVICCMLYIYGNILPSYIAQMLHVWNIYLHLPLKSTKCGYIYHTCSIWVGIITSHYKDPGSLLANQDFMEGQARVVTLPLLTCLQRTYVREWCQSASNLEKFIYNFDLSCVYLGSNDEFNRVLHGNFCCVVIIQKPYY